MQTNYEHIRATIESSPQEQQYAIAKSLSCLHVYNIVYANQSLKYRAIELEFELPLYTSEGEKTEFTYGGIIDGIVEQDNKLHVIDHKLLGQVKPWTFDVYRVSEQTRSYLLAGWQTGYDFDSFIYDVIVKPGISPRRNQNIPQTWQKELDSGVYHGIPFPYWQGEVRETPLMYFVRCVATLLGDTAKHFIRRPIRVAQHDLRRHNQLLIDSHLMTEKMRSDRNLWHPNSNSCSAFNSPCDFLGICSGSSTVADFPKKEGKGGCAMSPSRLQCMQSCLRKYAFKYIERLETPPSGSDALLIGSVFHSALEVSLQDKIVDPITQTQFQTGRT